MNVVLRTDARILVSFTADELVGICNSLNEVCHGVRIDDPEFETRLGVSRSFLTNLLRDLKEGENCAATRAESRAEAWADRDTVQALCVTVFGDPVDMGIEEAQCFVKELYHAIEKAES